jgi:uncharacterized membrane protein YccF (DUF307 family)
MRFVLNVLWLVLCGVWMFLAYLVAGVLWCVTIIGIPFGIASLRIGLFALWPFGRTVVRKESAGMFSGIGNILWFVFSGLWLAIGHVITGVLLCLTIIGIPLGLGSFKLVRVSLLPLGREIVPVDAAHPAIVPS